MNRYLDETPFFRGPYLSLTLFLCGASVLVVEIIGARMRKRYFRKMACPAVATV